MKNESTGSLPKSVWSRPQYKVVSARKGGAVTRRDHGNESPFFSISPDVVVSALDVLPPRTPVG